MTANVNENDIKEDDIVSDPMFYIAHGEDGTWRLFDCGEESAHKETRKEMVAFVHGLWRGMSIASPVDLSCAILDKKGNLIDTLYSLEMLKE